MIGDRRQYQVYIETGEEDFVMEYTNERDREILQMICSYLGTKSATALQTYDQERRDAALFHFRKKGLSVRQLERATGISRSVIQRAVQERDEG